ncbi:MAG: lamin tail domain-containing protein [Saprospiraceae bacterium]
MKNLIPIICFCLYLPGFIAAQLVDDFSDGNFTNNPAWIGNTTDFTITDAVLQLDATAAGTAYLASPVSINGASNWEFFVELDLNPSANGNFPKIYLSSDAADLTANLNGYFLRIGETGANDAFELFRQDFDGTTEFLLRFNTEGEMSASANNRARVKVTRDNTGTWNFAANYDGGNCFTDEGSITENTHSTGSHFGFSCQFTSGSVTKFFFDDIYVNATPPFQNLALATVKSSTSNTVEVSFSDRPETASASVAANYVIKDEMGQVLASPDLVTIDPSDDKRVVLTFGGAFSIVTGVAYTLCVNDVVDCNNNPIGTNNEQVFYLIEKASAFDIIINELLPDPTPAVSLPEFEFLELYNRSNKAISLENFQLIKDNTVSVLPELILSPNSYLIICKDEASSAYQSYGTTLVVDNLSLPNEDAELSLINPDGDLIDYVNYARAWYNDTDKDDGGFTLELINPNRLCDEASNWKASADSRGGTPGTVNSSLIISPDASSLQLLNIFVEDPTSILLNFNKKLDDANSSILSNYTVDQGIMVIDAELLNPTNKSVRISLSAPLAEGTIYTIEVLNSTTDCLGKPIGDKNRLSFGLPEEAAVFDIFVHEIMAAPTPTIGLPAVEYLELYNASDKLIELSGYSLEVGTSQRTLPNFQLLPKAYVIICPSLGLDSLLNFGAVLPMDDFPSLSNNGTTIVLSDPMGVTMHYLKYDQSTYQDNAKDDGGWSLEMINPNLACDGAVNWRASENPFGGTPGIVNSVRAEGIDEKRPDLLRVFPEDPNTLLLSFSEVMDQSSALEVDNYLIDQNVEIILAQLITPAKNQIRLFLSTPLLENTTYTISLRDQLTDCLGNPIGTFDEARFALPELAEEGDLIINEILYDPLTGGAEFIELYNNSSKVLNAGDLFLAKELGDPDPIRFNYLLFPGDYLVISPDVKDIQAKYTVKNPFALFQNDIPSLTNDEGQVILYRDDFPDIIILDQFNYNEDYHNALLSDAKGVSLERIDPNGSTQDGNNWHSAAKSVGYATPTYLNSQNFIANPGDDLISLSSDRLSPDGDAFEDFVQIFYVTPATGYTAKINIYDAQGRMIKQLVDQDLLAREGSYKWDGSTDNGGKARLGIYVLWVQLLNPNGDVREIKKTIVVAGQL